MNGFSDVELQTMTQLRQYWGKRVGWLGWTCTYHPSCRLLQCLNPSPQADSELNSGPEHTGYNCPPSFRAKQEHAENMRARQIKTVQIFCGMVLEWSLTPQYGIDFSRGEVNAVVPDKGPEPKVTFTSIIDVARTIATLVARYTPGQLPDSVKISGDALTLRELSQVCETIYRRPFTYRTIDVGQHRAYNSSTGTTISAYYQLLTGEGRLDFSTWNHNSWIPGTWLTVRDYLSLGQGNT